MQKEAVSRDRALDFAKGSCVIVMIIHHSLDYFPTSYVYSWYFRFVSSAFVFMAGFLATHLLFNKTARPETAKRLIQRGVKLIAICTLVNIAAALTVGNYKVTMAMGVPQKLWYVMSGLDYRFVSFDLLMPIGYLLLMLGGIVLIPIYRSCAVMAIGLVFFVYNTMEHFYLTSGYYSRFLGMGLVGAAFGLITTEKVNLILRYWIVIVLLFVVRWLIQLYLGSNYVLDVANTILSVMLIYVLGTTLDSDRSFVRVILLLGQYSLMSYLFQIVVLRIAKYGFTYLDIHVAETIIAFISTTLATVLFIKVLSQMRRTSLIVDSAYRGLFA